MMAASVDTAPATDHTDILAINHPSADNCTLVNHHIAALVFDPDFYVSFTRPIPFSPLKRGNQEPQAYFTLDRMGSYWQCKPILDHYECYLRKSTAVDTPLLLRISTSPPSNKPLLENFPSMALFGPSPIQAAQRSASKSAKTQFAFRILTE
jgi:hypothetical protein